MVGLFGGEIPLRNENVQKFRFENDQALAFDGFLDVLYTGHIDLNEMDKMSVVALRKLGGYFDVDLILEETWRYFSQKLKKSGTIGDILPAIMQIVDHRGSQGLVEEAKHVVANALLSEEERPSVDDLTASSEFGESVLELCQDLILNRMIVEGSVPRLSPEVALRMLALQAKFGGHEITPFMELCFKAYKRNNPNAAAASDGSVFPEGIPLAQLEKRSCAAADSAQDKPKLAGTGRNVVTVSAHPDLACRLSGPSIRMEIDYGDDCLYSAKFSWGGHEVGCKIRRCFDGRWCIYMDISRLHSCTIYEASASGGAESFRYPPSWGWKRSDLNHPSNSLFDDTSAIEEVLPKAIFLKFCTEVKRSEFGCWVSLLNYCRRVHRFLLHFILLFILGRNTLVMHMF